MPNPKIGLVSDRFALQYPNPEIWDYIGIPTTEGGKLKLGVNQGIKTKLYYDFTNSQAFAEVSMASGVGNFIFNFVLDNNDSVGIELIENSLFSFIKKNGVVSSESVTYDRYKHWYWRMRERYGVLLWETSSDGANWDIQRQAYHGLDLTSGKLFLVYQPVYSDAPGEPVTTGYGTGMYGSNTGYGVV